MAETAQEALSFRVIEIIVGDIERPKSDSDLQSSNSERLKIKDSKFKTNI